MVALHGTESIDREQIAVTAPSTAVPGVSHVRAEDATNVLLMSCAIADPMAIREFVASE